ncbi:MAG: SDR family oxidoreductase [Actinomycetales bacterium]
MSAARPGALVTGGGSGIGRAIALRLAADGYEVAIWGRTAEKLQGTIDRVPPQCRGRIHAQVVDIREAEQVDAALTELLQRFAADQISGIDVLVNNAGGQFVAAAESISAKGFRAVTRLNLDATWYLTTQVVSQSMLPRKQGKVICITMTPRRGMPGMSHSSAARAAVESLVRTWAVEWGPRGIRTVAIAPGIVHTEAIDRYGLDPAAMASVVPLGRLQRPEEIADLVCFLAGPTGDYVTGTTIVMDGGLDVSGPHPLQ